MADSPTGRSPLVYWSPAIQDRMNSIVVDRTSSPSTFQGQYSQLIYDLASVPTGEYGDKGLWATWMYQATGVLSWATNAFAKVQNGVFWAMSSTSLNDPRKYFIDQLVMYDWLYPALTTQQRDDFRVRLDYFAKMDAVKAGEVSAKRTPPNPHLSWIYDNLTFDISGKMRLPLSAGDSDQVVGGFFPHMLHTAVAPSTISGEIDALGVTGPLPLGWLGGLAVTNAAPTNMRNAVGWYCSQRAEGGVWCEASDYNDGSVMLLNEGYGALKTFYGGVDHFPEVRTFLEAAPLQYLHHLMPNRKHFWMWSDNGTRHATQWISAIGGGASPIAAMLALSGTLVGTEYGPELVNFCRTMWNLYPTIRPSLADARPILSCDPYAAEGDYTTLSRTMYAVGMGITSLRTSWTDVNAAAYHSWMSPEQGGNTDHMGTTKWCSDFHLFRKEEYIFTDRLAYDTASSRHSFATNAMSLGGLHRPDEYKKEAAVKVGSGTSYLYSAFTVGGNHAGLKDYYTAVAETSWMEQTRETVFLPSTDGSIDTIIVFDRARCTDPATLPLFARLPSAYESHCNGKTANKIWRVQCPVTPTLVGTTNKWDTAGGQHVAVQTLLPKSGEVSFFTRNQSTDPLFSLLETDQKKFLREVYYTTDAPFLPFLHVCQAYDNPSLAYSNTLIESADGNIRGVKVTRPGHDDEIWLFNATPSSDLPPATFVSSRLTYTTATETILDNVRFLTIGNSVSFTPSTANWKLRICGLKVGENWQHSLNGGADTPLAEGAEGLAEISGSGASLQVLAFGVGGAPPPTNPPGPVSLLTPADGATGISRTPTLTVQSANAATYDFYFGTASNPPQVTTDQASSSYSPSTLAYETLYYWKVVARNVDGTATSVIGSFTTIPETTPESPQPRRVRTRRLGVRFS